jgi:glycosyltransferase involved in cell wall biosynthesis
MGGAESLSLTLVSGLKGITTTVATQAAIAERFASSATKVRLFEEGGLTSPYDYKPLNALRYAAFVAKLVAEERPDAVLAVMQAASIFLALASVTKPIVLNRTRRFGSIHGHTGAYFRMLGRRPSIAELFYLKLIASRLERIVLPSAGVKEDLINLIPDAQSKLEVIYNGVDSTALERLVRAEPALPSPRHRIVMAARLSRQKDHATLFRAFATLTQSHAAELILLGEGEERAHLQDLAAALGIQGYVTFAGHLDNPYPVIASADVFVLISHFEGFGLALLEAMALGRAVVATDCPSGPAEIIRNGIDGYLVPPRDPRMLVQRLRSLLDDPELRAALGRSAKMRATDFSATRMIDGYRRLLFSGAYR